ncbi:MAG: hypothetical protein R3C19_01895 [Planctomycetaceae bacterium]
MDVLSGEFDDEPEFDRVQRIRRVFEDCGVFSKAETLVERSRERAEALIEEVDDNRIRDLLRFFVETVLAEDTPPTAAEHLDPVEPTFVNLGAGPVTVVLQTN